MESWNHGGDWVAYQLEYGRPPLDFSSNLSPLGLPEQVQKAVLTSLDHADRYPDPFCRLLCRRLGEHLRLSPQWILCGNGAADLIYRMALALRPRRALVTAPAFSEYQRALTLAGCRVDCFSLKERLGFTVTEAILPAITPELDLLFLCEPNNPTGLVTPRPLLKEILQVCSRRNTLLVVDECFNSFLPEPDAHTLMNELAGYPNLVILRAFTKEYAMAGLRLGYLLCSDPALVERIRQGGPPWSVSTPAQAAGVAALDLEHYRNALHSLILEERPRLYRELERMGCRVIPGQANYLLFFHPDPDLCFKLRDHGVLLRDCRDYAGLGIGWYRAAVRTREENEAFLQIMREVLLNG